MTCYLGYFSSKYCWLNLGLPLSIGTCQDEHSEVKLKDVYDLAAPKFGEKMAHYAERSRLWVVEINRADAKIVELLSATTDPTQDLAVLRRDIDRLNDELISFHPESSAFRMETS